MWNTPAGSHDAADTAARLREVFADWHEPIRTIIDATPTAAVIRSDIYDLRPARTWGRGRVALIGDAIHPMTPDLAQGACQAILDATTLATCLAASRDTGAAIRDYQRRRWPNAAVTTLMARNMGAVGQRKGHTVCAARNALIGSIPLSLQLRQFDLVLGTHRRPS
jgi:2-polyprenyl-6-methoxyphenol hydroxylase-like FAD-dependent oxidoreductase